MWKVEVPTSFSSLGCDHKTISAVKKKNAEGCGPEMYSGRREKRFAEKLSNLKFWTTLPGFH